MKLLIISLVLLCTACTSIPTPQEKPQVAWFAMGYGCPEYEDIAPEFQKKNSYGVVGCFEADSTDDPTFTGGYYYGPDDYWHINNGNSVFLKNLHGAKK